MSESVGNPPVRQYRPRASKDEINEVVSIIDGNGDTVSVEDHKQRLMDNVVVNPDGTASCRICGKTFSGTGGNGAKNARRHVEVHIEGLNYNCSQCGKSFRSKNSLQIHLYRFHK